MRVFTRRLATSGVHPVLLLFYRNYKYAYQHIQFKYKPH